MRRALLAALILLILVLLIWIGVPAAREWTIQRKLEQIKPGVSPDQLRALFGPPIAEGTGPGMKRAPMVPEPIDSEHVIPHDNLLPTDHLSAHGVPAAAAESEGGDAS